MRYIDKAQNSQKGKQITTDFLETICKEPNGRYTGIRYDDRDNGTKRTFCAASGRMFRKRMIRVLLENQSDLCCYCMRKLKTAQDEESEELVTIEHIIPREYSVGNCPRLPEYQQAPELSPNEVVLTDVFESNGYDQSSSAQPHKVAYNNFVASCNGTFPFVIGRRGGKSKICCNEARKAKMAYPIYFLRNIDRMVDYETDGSIQPKMGTGHEGQIEEVINHAQLDCSSLKDIRRLWYELRVVPYQDIFNCRTDAQRENLFSKILYTSQSLGCDDAVRLHNKFVDANQWNTFMLYNVFYSIMITKYPA